MVYPTLPRKKQQEPISENSVDPLAPFPNKKNKIQQPKIQTPNFTLNKSKIQTHKTSKKYLKGVWNGLPHLATKKTTRTHQWKQCRPPGPFSKQKIKNPTTQDPNSKFPIEQIQNPNPQNIQKIS